MMPKWSGDGSAHKQSDCKERNIPLICGAPYKNFVIKPEEIPESYWETQVSIAREQGHGEIEATREILEQGAKIIIADQESSLDNWVDCIKVSNRCILK